MNDISTPRTYRCDLNHGTCIVNLKAPLMHQDSLADVFRVAVCRANVPVDLAGMGVTGYLYYASTRQTLLLQGTTDGHYASVALSSPCYATPGYASLVIQLQDGDVRHTLLKANLCIDRTGTESVLDPEDVLPSLPDLLGQIETLRAVTAQGKEVIAGIQADTDAAIARTDAAAASADAAAQAAEAAGQEAVRIAREASQPAIAASQEAAQSAQEAAQSSLDAAESAQTAAATLASVQETVTQETAQAVETIDAREAEAVEAVAARETAAASALDAQKAASVQAVHLAAQAAAAQQEEAIAAKGAEVLASIPEDYTALHAAVQQNTADILLQAPAIIETATGSIVSIKDGADRPAVQLISHIDPVQGGEGDPSPENVRPVHGWGQVTAQRNGSNLAAEIQNVGLGSQPSGGYIVSNYANTKSICAKVKQGCQYTVSRRTTETGSRFRCGFTVDRYTGTDVTMLSGVVSNDSGLTMTVIAPDKARYLYVYVDNTGAEVDLMQYTINVGDAALPYEPYCGQTLTADLPETVYGGTLDWDTGVLTVDTALLTIDGSIVEGWGVSSKDIGYVILTESRAVESCGVCCDRYPVWNESSAPSISAIRTTNKKTYLYDQRFESEQAAIDLLNAEKPQFVFKLKAPYTIQLTPQQLDMLKGTNNVWSDCGNTDLSYVADTKLYIDRKIAAIAAATV